MNAEWAVAAALASGLCGGCIASNVVAREDRAVVAEANELAWSKAPLGSLDGLFESIEIEGDAAARLWKVYYLFEPGGRYTAAALVITDSGPAFQTLDGGWRITVDGLVLDDGEPAPLAASEDGAHLLIAAATGTVVLRRAELR